MITFTFVIIQLFIIGNLSSDRFSKNEKRVYCYLPVKPGRCEAYIERWFYNRKTDACEKFIYGGCEGNKNNFQSKLECKKACVQLNRICYLPAVVGNCKAAIPRWYFDKEKFECKEFTYGGCGGNKNNFASLEDCKKVCS